MMWANDNSWQRSVLTSELHGRMKRDGIGVKSCPGNGRVPRAMCIVLANSNINKFFFDIGRMYNGHFYGIYHNSYSLLDSLIFFI